MTAVAFDTLKFARTLRDKANLSAQQAEGFADAIAEVVQGDVATKSDIGSLKTDIGSLKTDIEALKLSTKADLRESEARLEAKVEATKAEIMKWMFGTVGFQTLIVLGAVIALARLIR
jgi:hypothetical protein